MPSHEHSIWCQRSASKTGDKGTKNMGHPSVLTVPTAPVPIPNPVSEPLMDRLLVIPNPDTLIDSLIPPNLIALLLTILLHQKYSPDTESKIKTEYDYIIVGAGAAGSVLANRLSEEKCVTVLLLEAGKTPPVLSEFPGLGITLKATDANWKFKTEPQKHTAEEQNERRIPFDCGKGLGGSTLINGMFYSRGNSRDYDDWEAMGAKGWSFKDCFPYFLKLEDNIEQDLAANRDCHNVSGPMTFSRPRYIAPLRDPILKGARSLGYEMVDVNCEKQLGFADLQASIRGGQRCSAAKAYLVPADSRTNLDIVTEAFVTKIQISNNITRGVCFDYKGSSRCVKAKREVIVSAGAVNSPKLLILSGVGPRETLKKFKIKEHANLPVGHNLQDHVSTIMFYEVSTDVPYSTKIANPLNVLEYNTNRSGPLASPGSVFSVGFHRSADATTPEGVPNFEIYFTEGNNLFVKSFGMKLSTYTKLFLPYALSATEWCMPSVVRPKSRGHVSIKSTDPYDDPVIDPKYFSDPQDRVDIVAGMRLCEQIANTDEVKKAGVTPFKTVMPGCEHFPKGTDEYLECYSRKFASTTWHPTSTVKMGDKDDPTAVVDPEFRVKGIERLRVIDASAMPKVVSGNTMVPTMMMAEKGSDIIKKSISCS